MIGRRLPDSPDGSLPKMEPGDYVHAGDLWMVLTPNGSMAFLNAGHQLTVHEDGTLTVSPSILIPQYHDSPGWHGYLERGVWREV